MKKFLINVMFLLMAVFSGVALFSLKYQVKEKETELKRIHVNILKTKRDLHMLEAEWAHLNDPKRLKAIVTNQTDWKVIKSEQLIKVDDLPIKLEEAETKSESEGEDK